MKIRKILSFLLCLWMAVQLLPIACLTAFADQETILIAASDFQPKNGGKSGIQEVEKILTQIRKDGITKADGMLFCGDYDYGTFGVAEKTKEGIGLLTDAMSDIVEPENMVFGQGNHDAMAGTSGLSYSGNRDPESGKYGLFVINEDDYMWYNKDETRIKRTAQRLIDYMNGKLSEGYTQPIFVISHLPLHYNMRTVRDGDGMFASYIFDVLNTAGEKGLNIIFLFGHDHSNGWDDYLGAGSIYLPKGDSIHIADNSKDEFKTHTLQFTYMNAGYVGYYDVNNTGADGTLTMTSFRIDNEGRVTITRYDNKGLHNLKSKGVRNEYKEETAYLPNEKVYPSRQTIEPTKVKDASPIPELVKLTGFGRQYQRINSLDELRSGGKYILVYHSDVDQFLCPRVVSKSDSDGTRVGFDLRNAYAFGDAEAYGNYDIREWMLTKVGDKWQIGYENTFVAFTETQDRAVTATLEKEADLFTIEGEVAFTFSSGGFFFNYNQRGLMNAYASDPATFYIYEYVGYSLAVTDGTATVDGKIVNVVYGGTELTLTASEAPEGMFFDKWVVEQGDLVLPDPTKEEITFRMPEDALRIRATYTDKDPNAKSDDNNQTVVIVIVSAAALVLLGAGTGTAVILRKRRK